MLDTVRRTWRVGSGAAAAGGDLATPVQAAVDAMAARRTRLIGAGLLLGSASCLLLLGWRLTEGDLTPLDAVLLPAFALSSAGLALALRWRPAIEQDITRGLFLVTALALVAKLYELLHVQRDPGPLVLGDVLVWFPLPMALAFLGCRGRRPVVMVGLFLAVTAATTLAALPGASPELQAFLVRFLFAQASIFLVLVAAIDLGESSTRAAATVQALHGAAYADGLTGVANRRALEDRMASWPDATAGSWLGGIILDLDRFKRINDDHGHATGDDVLRSVAIALQRQLRPGDLLGRWGGEEFVVLLRGADTEGAARVAERLRAAVEREVAVAGAPVTVSVGVAVEPAPLSPQAWLQAADAALYRAKAGGRNQVVVAAPAPAISVRAAG